jgi:hypothetical protein
MKLRDQLLDIYKGTGVKLTKFGMMYLRIDINYIIIYIYSIKKILLLN